MRRTKHTVYSVLFFLSSFIYFFFAYKGLKRQNINLDNYTVIKSTIVDKGVDYHYGSKGRKSLSFYIRLKGTNKNIGVYRMTKNYEDLLDKLTIGDTVTAYYRENSNESENINIDLVQVERNGQTVLDKKEYEKKESALIYIGLTAGFLTILLSYLYYKRKINSNQT